MWVTSYLVAMIQKPKFQSASPKMLQSANMFIYALSSYCRHFWKQYNRQKHTHTHKHDLPYAKDNLSMTMNFANKFWSLCHHQIGAFCKQLTMQVQRLCWQPLLWTRKIAKTGRLQKDAWIKHVCLRGHEIHIIFCIFHVTDSLLIYRSLNFNPLDISHLRM